MKTHYDHLLVPNNTSFSCCTLVWRIIILQDMDATA